MSLPERKQNRLEKSLYNQGAYFVTICTKDRKKVLSDIVGAIHESPGRSATSKRSIHESTLQINNRNKIIIRLGEKGVITGTKANPPG